MYSIFTVSNSDLHMITPTKSNIVKLTITITPKASVMARPEIQREKAEAKIMQAIRELKDYEMIEINVKRDLKMQK